MARHLRHYRIGIEPTWIDDTTHDLGIVDANSLVHMTPPSLRDVIAGEEKLYAYFICGEDGARYFVVKHDQNGFGTQSLNDLRVITDTGLCFAAVQDGHTFTLSLTGLYLTRRSRNPFSESGL